MAYRKRLTLLEKSQDPLIFFYEVRGYILLQMEPKEKNINMIYNFFLSRM